MRDENGRGKFRWASDANSDSSGARALLPAVILAVTFISYAATLSFGFVFDDHGEIVVNDSIRAWRYLPSYFTSHVWSFLYPHMLSNYYRPVFLVWLRLNHALFGLHPWGWHLTSVLAHVAVTYLVYCLALRLTRDTWVAAAAGLIFGLHPVHVEAVAYVSAVPELLAALFMLAAMLAWLRAREGRRNVRWFAAALALYSIALLSKEGGMMLPIFIAVYAWIHGGGEGGGTALGKRLRATLVAVAPFLALTLAYVPLRVWVLKGFAHAVTPVPLRTEILTIPSVLVFYLRLLLWPLPLSCYYDTPYVSAATLRGFFMPLLGVLVTLAVLAIWYLRTRRAWPGEARTLAFAGLWLAFAILPVLNFRLLPEGEIAHDRYLYLPSVGFAILVAVALRQALRGYFHVSPAWVAAGAVLACLAMGATTLYESLYWADNLSLNDHAHAIAPQNVYATTSLAAAAAERGMTSAAVSLYQQALAARPAFWRANVNLAYLYYQKGDYAKAARYFQRSCAADPTDGDQFLYLGMAEMQLNDLSRAESAIRTALLVRPHGKDYHLGLGLVLKEAGKVSEARQEFAAALAENPNDQRAASLLAESDRLLKGQSEKPALPSPSSGHR